MADLKNWVPSMTVFILVSSYSFSSWLITRLFKDVASTAEITQGRMRLL
jgi:hypothetical protein